MSASSKNAKITAASIVRQVITDFPATREVFRRHKLDCLSCKGAQRETIREAARTHGLDPKQLLDELQKAAG